MIPWFKPYFFGNEKEFLNDALNSTWISGGPYVDKLESELSKILRSKYVITTSNGTTALNLALLSLNISDGDEVIVPDFTFVAPGNVVLQVGAKPVFVDIDKDTWCISPDAIKKAITPKTRAIIVVHIYGNVCEMDKIMQIAKENNLYVIEDVAEALFSKYNGRYVGTFGDIGCLSFQATKTITTGEGGAVITNNNFLAQKMRKIRNHGMTEKRYWHDVIGYNFRLTNLQAALGCAQLEKLQLIIENKKKVYVFYLKNLKNIKGIKFQKVPEKAEPVMWAVAIRIQKEKFKQDRDFLMKELLERGIETRPGFYPFSILPPYNAQKCEVSESISKDIIVLPSYPSLEEKDMGYICEQLRNLIR